MPRRNGKNVKKYLLAVALMCLSLGAAALEAGAAVKVEPLLKTGVSWDGTPLAWPQGPAEVTAMRVEIAPGAETGWHSHTVPSFAVMLEGTLVVRLKDGRTRRLQAGDVLAEVVDTLHNGHNVGSMPVKLVVFYTGVAGQGHTLKAERQPIGGQRDAHGCLPAAGYSWCEREKSCVRSWELEKQKGGFGQYRNFAGYCSGASAP